MGINPWCGVLAQYLCPYLAERYMKRRMSPVAVLALILAYGASVQAAEYKDVNRTASQISFTYKQLGQRVYGTFSDFEGTLTFDTLQPEAGHALLKIQLASIDAGSPDANDELQRASWFDTATYPVGVYESTGVKALGDNRYRIRATWISTASTQASRWCSRSWCVICFCFAMPGHCAPVVRQTLTSITPK